MGKLAGIGIGLGVTFLGIIWFYGIIYNWLWLGLVHSTSTGWIVGYVILFILFLFLSIPVGFFLLLGYLGAIEVGCD